MRKTARISTEKWHLSPTPTSLIWRSTRLTVLCTFPQTSMTKARKSGSSFNGQKSSMKFSHRTINRTPHSRGNISEVIWALWEIFRQCHGTAIKPTLLTVESVHGTSKRLRAQRMWWFYSTTQAQWLASEAMWRDTQSRACLALSQTMIS